MKADTTGVRQAMRPAPAQPRDGSPVDDVALWRRLTAEFAGQRVPGRRGDRVRDRRREPVARATGLELLENAAATAAGLFAIILMFGPVSGGHFNPVVSFADAAFGGLRWRDAAAYLPAQVAGCIAGAVAANLMFSQPAISISVKNRATPAHFLSEIIATLGLLLVIFALARSGRSRSAPAAVGAYIGAAYFFTSSTSFANPAITIGRMFSDTFAGIAPSSARRSSPPRSSAASWPSSWSRVLYPGSPRPRPPTSSSPHHAARRAPLRRTRRLGLQHVTGDARQTGAGRPATAGQDRKGAQGEGKPRCIWS